MKCLFFRIMIVQVLVTGSNIQRVQAQNFDINLLKQINPAYPVSKLWNTISSTAEPIAGCIPIGMIAWSLITENHSLEMKSYEAAGSLILTAAVTEGLKVAINRQRPYVTYPNLIHPDTYETDGSFPSAHTSLAFATATNLLLETKKWYIALPAYGWALSVGYSRMYLGQHYPTDILAGAITGTASAWLTHWVNKKYCSGKTKTVKTKI